MNNSTSILEVVEEDRCEYFEQPYHRERFILVAIIGTIISVVNIVENVFLCFMLFTRKSYRSSYMLYWALLAFFDVFIAGAYIPLMSLNHIVDYLQSVTLLRAWFSYMIPMITISHIAMTASSFLMVAASFERYCVTVKPQYTKFLNRNRFRIAFGSVFFGVITKITHGLEFSVTLQEECVGTMSEYTLALSPLAQTPAYSVFKIWVRSILTILLPFALLAFMNLRIVLVIQRKELQFVSAQKLSEAKRKSRVRAATRTLVLVVFTYLLSNVLNVIITIWEYIDNEGLVTQLTGFYMISVDLVSLLTIFAGALRLPIYMTCQSEVRKEFVSQLKKFYYWSPYKILLPQTPTKRRRPHDVSKEQPLLSFCNGYNQTTMSTTLEDIQHVDTAFENSDESTNEGHKYPGLFMHLAGTVLLKADAKGDTVIRMDRS